MVNTHTCTHVCKQTYTIYRLYTNGNRKGKVSVPKNQLNRKRKQYERKKLQDTEDK